MSSLNEPVNVGVGMVVLHPYHPYTVLLGQRIGKHGDGEWALPGGKPEPRESPIDAVIRETEEEIGIEVSKVRPLPVWTYDKFPDHDLHFVTLYFVCEVYDDPKLMEPDKCAGWEWFRVRDLPEPLFCGAKLAIHSWVEL